MKEIELDMGNIAINGITIIDGTNVSKIFEVQKNILIKLKLNVTSNDIQKLKQEGDLMKFNEINNKINQN